MGGRLFLDFGCSVGQVEQVWKRGSSLTSSSCAFVSAYSDASITDPDGPLLPMTNLLWFSDEDGLTVMGIVTTQLGPKEEIRRAGGQAKGMINCLCLVLGH